MTDGNATVAVRDEDSFDLSAALDWLRIHAAEEFRSAVAGQPEVRQFPGGASNLTYLLRFPDAELILRRPPAGSKAAGAHDLAREYRIQAALRPHFPQVAPMVALCQDPGVLGADFYVMAKVPGTILRRDLPSGLLEPDQAGELCRHAVDCLVDLHAVEVAEVPDLAALGRGDGYVRRQVSGWINRLERAATADLPAWQDVGSWLDREQPADVGQRMIHNDFRFDNLVLAPEDPLRIVAVLDWELATVGDPLMDLGAVTAYWTQADDDPAFQEFRRQPTNAPGMWTRREVVEHYLTRTGRELSTRQWRFYEVYGLFRLAVIAQQIWYRYFHGQTTNPAYAPFGPAVALLIGRCRELMAPGSA